MPEGYAAIRAARRDRLQTSLNLALGSALASIGFTIPAVAILSLFNGWTLVLGLAPKESVLLGLALLVSSLSLNTGRTTVLQGAVHLMIFLVYVFTVFVP
jgi:Ca2+:H+ antiporter